MKRTTGTALAACLLVVLLASGCGEECNRPFCNNLKLPEPTLENVWPNQDETWWSFDYRYRLWDMTGEIVYPDSTSVPPMPSLDDLAGLVDYREPGSNTEVTAGTYRLEFDGEMTTGPGVTAQNLVETLETAGGQVGSRFRHHPASVLLARLALARPDLRDKMTSLGLYPDEARPDGESRSTEGQCGPTDGRALRDASLLDSAREPIFIHGYAWEKTEEWIGTYGYLDTLLAWKFLEADLEPLHEFTHRLVPELADNVYLHCRVLSKSISRIGPWALNNVLICLYAVDYGIWPYRDTHGNPIAWTRLFDYGIVAFAPTIGPIYDYERLLVSAGDTTYTGTGDVTLSFDAASTFDQWLPLPR